MKEINLKYVYDKAYKLVLEAKQFTANSKEAILYARKYFDKNELRYCEEIGFLSSEQVSLLKCETNILKFSVDSVIKNILEHPDLDISDYNLVSYIANDYDKMMQDRENHIKLFKKINEKIYEMVIKTTKNKQENYIVSLHFSNKRRMKK